MKKKYSISPFFPFFIPGVILSFNNETISAKTKQNSDQEIKSVNILIITADDLGKHLSCYGDKIQTPNIDNLALNGIIFHNGYVTQASSSPSRSSILTGLFPHFNGQLGLSHHGFKINPENVKNNIPTFLKNHGYRSGIIGKLHVEPTTIFPFDYERKSIEETRNMELVVERLEEFIGSSGEEPFFLYINYFDPHVPLVQKSYNRPHRIIEISDIHPFGFQGVNDSIQLQRIADYYSCVQRLDEGIGLVMKKMEELKVLDNTLIIFVGDNGAPFARAKGACYESSVNVPFIISCPRIIKENIQSNALVSTIDIFPTIIEMLDKPVPEEIHGISLLPILNGTKKNTRQYLFTEYNYHGNSLDHFFPRRTIRDGRYKLILNLASGKILNGLTAIDGDTSFHLSKQEKYKGTWIEEVYNRLQSPPEVELFDLKNDPFERNNLAGGLKYKIKIKKMRKKLKKWMVDTNDPYLLEESILKEIYTF